MGLFSSKPKADPAQLGEWQRSAAWWRQELGKRQKEMAQFKAGTRRAAPGDRNIPEERYIRDQIKADIDSARRGVRTYDNAIRARKWGR